MMKGDVINNYAVIVLRKPYLCTIRFCMFGVREETGLIDCRYYWM